MSVSWPYSLGREVAEDRRQRDVGDDERRRATRSAQCGGLPWSSTYGKRHRFTPVSTRCEPNRPDGLTSSTTRMTRRLTTPLSSWPMRSGCVAGRHGLEDAEHEAGEHGAEEAVEAAERRRRRGREEDREHHRRVDVAVARRDQRAADGADGGRQAPRTARTCPVLMPTSGADSGLLATARMARPNFVRWKRR